MKCKHEICLHQNPGNNKLVGFEKNTSEHIQMYVYLIATENEILTED